MKNLHVYYMVQYTPEWWETRRGVPTASQADRLITPVKWERSNGKKYLYDLVAETADLRPNWFTDNPMSPAQRHGLETEHEARTAYALETGDEAQQVGFVYSPDMRAGCSPDGIIPGRNAGLELKCVQLATLVEYLMEGGLPVKYKPQVHFQLAITGWEYVDFFAYAPGRQGPQHHMVRVRPDKDTERLKEVIGLFNVEYDAALAAVGLQRRVPPAPPPQGRYGEDAA